jgi:hypothetical protein
MVIDSSVTRLMIVSSGPDQVWSVEEKRKVAKSVRLHSCKSKSHQGKGIYSFPRYAQKKNKTSSGRPGREYWPEIEDV